LRERFRAEVSDSRGICRGIARAGIVQVPPFAACAAGFVSTPATRRDLWDFAVLRALGGGSYQRAVRAVRGMGCFRNLQIELRC